MMRALGTRWIVLFGLSFSLIWTASAMASEGLVTVPPPTPAEATGGDPVGVRIPAEVRQAVAHLGLAPLVGLGYGTFDWLVLEAEDYARVAASGLTHQTFRDPYTLRLGELSFDPVAHPPNLPSEWNLSRTEGSDLHLVQFAGPTKAEWLTELEQRGLEVVQYIHPFTYVVWGEASTRTAASESSGIRNPR